MHQANFEFLKTESCDLARKSLLSEKLCQRATDTSIIKQVFIHYNLHDNILNIDTCITVPYMQLIQSMVDSPNNVMAQCTPSYRPDVWSVLCWLSFCCKMVCMAETGKTAKNKV